MTDTTFDDFLREQVHREDAVGDIARDYITGVQTGSHGTAAGVLELTSILHAQHAPGGAYDAVEQIGQEWSAAHVDQVLYTGGSHD